jgi:hypothetical protein
MTHILKKAIDALSSLEELPEEEQKNLAAEILEIVESARSSLVPPVVDGPTEKGRKPIWEVIYELMEDVPEEELEKLPTDGAREHDHYLYGSPKRYS